MKFDLVVGNPPYNNDMYLDFVIKGHNLSKGYSLWITPTGLILKNSDILSKLKTICYYPDEGDIFTIKKPGGLGFYLLSYDNNIGKISITNKSMLASCLDSLYIRDVNDCFLNKGYDVITKVNNLYNINNIEFKSLDVEHVSLSLKYFVYSSNMIAYCNSRQCPFSEKTSKPHGFFSTDGNTNVLPKLFKEKSGSSIAKAIFSSNVESEIDSFISYLETKFIKFLVLSGMNASSIYNNYTFRFVPTPDAFDHIFTDDELYKKYNLTDEEISIIESVIKSR